LPAINVVDCPEQGLLGVKVGTAGAKVTTTEVVVLNKGHDPLAGIVYVTVYVPGALPDGVMAPVVELIDNPVGAALNVPPNVP
jgi:hypothetical protein